MSTPDPAVSQRLIFEALPPERQHFRTLLAVNPNYFGSLKESGLPVVKPLQSSTTYEVLKCVGFDPQFDQLNAVVWTLRPNGYGGGLCAPGTEEYVRFYVSFDEGGHWQDWGVTGFAVHDTGVTEPLEHAVTLKVNPRKLFCTSANLPMVRAILQWNSPPPANSPNFVPVWGNVVDTHIQIGSRRRFYPIDLVTELKLPASVTAVLSATQVLEAPEPKALSALELHQLYEGKDVPVHRTLFAELQKAPFASGAAQAGATVHLQPVLSPALLAGASAESLAALLTAQDGNTTFEQLGCIGHDANVSTLVATIRVKKPNGFSGGLCTAGSREYVAFYLDAGGGWTYVGTTSVRTHDLQKIPGSGVDYACFLPVDLAKYVQPCGKGPRVLKMRAILSWQVPPTPGDPDYKPVWGNHHDTHILVKPGSVLNPDVHPPVIETVGGISTSKIDAAGLATGLAATAGYIASDSPFGGLVVITGHIANPPDISQGAATLKYRILVSGDGGAHWQALNDAFDIQRSQLQNGIWSTPPDLTQVPDAEGWYDYREDLSGGGANAIVMVQGNVLHRWQTAGKSGDWLIRAEVTDTPAMGAQFSTAPVKVRLDNTAPTVDLKITSGGGNCADFTIGDTISGVFTATDEHFGGASLSLQPANGGVFTPASIAYPAAGTGVTDAAWSLDTTGLPRCGYVVRIVAGDRTIVNSGFVGWSDEKFVGLCLRQK
jgi:hypothetical protein